jgi:hypothetical protein
MHAPYLGKRKYDLAIEHYTEGIESNPGGAAGKGVDELFVGRGVAKLKAGDTAGGNNDLAAARAIEASALKDWVGVYGFFGLRQSLH